VDSTARRTFSDDVQWVRGRARFEDGAIILEPTTVRDYSVLAEGADALWKLGAIRRPQDAVDFARRFGLLHHGPGTELREPWTDWESTALHIHSILVTATLLRVAGWEDDPEATEYIREITSTPEWNALWEAPARDHEQRRMQVGAWVASRVTAGLAGMEWGIRSDAEVYGGARGAPDVFLYSPRPSNLLGWIYYNLAQTLIGAKRTRRCEGCGVVFLVHDDRQRYHDKQCAQRARYHRSADRRRQGE
jgi:hypothetical protein